MSDTRQATLDPTKKGSAGIGQPTAASEGDARVDARGASVDEANEPDDQPARDTVAPGDSGSAAPATRDGRKAVLWTTALCVLLGAAGHLLLLAGWVERAPGQNDNALPWQPVVGASLTAVAVLAFGGFYYASLRARVAIMSSFILTFLLLLTYVLTVREIQPNDSQTLVESLLGDFRIIVQTIIGFYFGTETVLSITKILRAPRGDAAAIRRADRDLPSG